MNKKELNPMFSELSTQESATINGGANSSSYHLSPEAIARLRDIVNIRTPVIIKPILPWRPPSWGLKFDLLRYLANKK